jgi:hypothetical protein
VSDIQATKCFGNRSLTYWLSLGVVLAGILFRTVYLDADPHYYEWVGYITDEGRWIQHARSLAIQGILLDGNLHIHLFLAPLFQLTNYLVFEMAGISLLTSRMLSALCGSALLLLFFGCLRDAVSPQALLLGTILLAFQTDLVVLSRVAVPEIVVMFFQLAIYFVIVSRRRSSRRMVFAGLLLLAACGMKATTLFMAPIFSLMIFFMPRQATDSRKGDDLILFWAGFIVPLLAAGFFFYFFLFDQFLSFLDGLERFSPLSRRFVGLSSLYSVISFPFANPLSPTFNLWVLGIWLTVVGVAMSRDKIDFRSRRYLATAAIWIVLYMILMLSMDYFPTRYKVHLLIPLAVFITVGTSLVQQLEMRSVTEFFARAKGLQGLLWLGIVGFPTAAVISPLLALTAAWFGIDADRALTKLGCFMFLATAMILLVNRFKQNQHVLVFLLIFPLVAALSWTISSTLWFDHSFWPSAEINLAASSISREILCAAVISAALPMVRGRWKRMEGLCLITVFAIVYMIVLLARILPGYADRHYTMRDVSRDLGNLLQSFSTITTLRAETLFTENNLRYTSFQKFRWQAQKPEILVIAFGSKDEDAFFGQQYVAIKRYSVYVAPEYFRSGVNSGKSVSQEIVIRVYKKSEVT